MYIRYTRYCGRKFEISTEGTKRYSIWRIWDGKPDRNAFNHIIPVPLFLSGSAVSLFPLPLEENSHTPIVIEATTPVGVDEKLGETSFIRVSRFNSRRAVRDIRESSLIVFNRDTVCTWGERIHEGREACMHVPRRREYLSGRAGRSSGWRATVRVSDQLTICRRTRGWFEPPVIRQKIWAREQWDLGQDYENNGRVSSGFNSSTIFPVYCVRSTGCLEWMWWFLVEVESKVPFEEIDNA